MSAPETDEQIPKPTAPFSSKDRTLKENYSYILTKLNRNKKKMTKEDEIEIAHLINHIESYGFGFFSSHYVYDELVELFNISNKISGSKDNLKV